jgi:hypothetical protein
MSCTLFLRQFRSSRPLHTDGEDDHADEASRRENGSQGGLHCNDVGRRAWEGCDGDGDKYNARA